MTREYCSHRRHKRPKSEREFENRGHDDARKVEQPVGAGVPAKRCIPPSNPEDRPLAPIDYEIAQLEFPPAPGADCPPCINWRWWDGYKPAKRTLVQMEIVAPEVRAARASTYLRKLEISAAVRDYWDFPRINPAALTSPDVVAAIVKAL